MDWANEGTREQHCARDHADDAQASVLRTRRILVVT